MTQLLSIEPRTASLAARALSIARFVLHFGEMVLAMYVGMLIYMPLEGLFPTGLQGIGMALFMAWPMVVWMRVRGHGWQHGLGMSLAMLVPWAVLLAAANVIPALANVADWAMYLGMLAYMLVRRDHHAHHAGTHDHSAAHSAMPRRWRFHFRPLLLAIAYLAAVVFVPVVIGFINLGNHMTAQRQPPEGPAVASSSHPALPVPDSNKKIAVVLSSAYGAEITDTLPNFEILADSGAFNVYSVAPERTVLPLVSEGFTPTTLDFIPHFSFAEYDSQIGRAPDLIVIPGIPFYTPERDAAVVDWIRTHDGPNTTILGICVGGIILADTGLLSGHTATTNAGVYFDLSSKHPDTTWVPNVRYLDDGSIVTSTTLASGIDATLHVVDRFAGRATALQVARQIGYTHTDYLDDPRWTWPIEQYPNPATLDDRMGPVFTSAMFRGLQRVGVPLYDGVSEAGLAGLLDPTFESLDTRSYVMAPQRTVVRSRNDFRFVPRYDFDTVPTPDRVLIPAGPDSQARRQVIAAWSADRTHRPVEDIFQNVGNGETAYQASFEDIAQTQNRRLALADANLLFYAVDSTRIQGTDWAAPDALFPLLPSLFGTLAVFGLTHLRLPRRNRLQAIPQPA